MAVRVSKDTYVYEQAGPDTFVRRQVFAGQPVPEGWFEDEEGKTPFTGDPVARGAGLGASVAAYKHQLDESGNLAEEHAAPAEETAEAKPRGTARKAAE